MAQRLQFSQPSRINTPTDSAFVNLAFAISCSNMAQASIWAFSNGFLVDLDPRGRPSRLFRHVQTTYECYGVVTECYDMMRKIQIVVWQGLAFGYFCQVRIVVVGLDNSGFELSTVKRKLHLISLSFDVVMCCAAYVECCAHFLEVYVCGASAQAKLRS